MTYSFRNTNFFIKSKMPRFCHNFFNLSYFEKIAIKIKKS